MDVLSILTRRWQEAIRAARKTKRDLFARQAADAMRFYGSDDHSFMFDRDYQSQSIGMVADLGGDGQAWPAVMFKPTINLTSNVVQVFLPVLYYENPVRTVKPRVCQLAPDLLARAGLGGYDPIAGDRDLALKQVKAELIHWRLNATPRELSLKEHARLSVLEALVKGMGLLVGTVHEADDGTRLFGLAHESIDHWFVDADAEHPTWSDAGFVIRRRIRPVGVVEDEFGYPRGTLAEKSRKNLDTGGEAYPEVSDDDCGDEDELSLSQEMFVYYEVYSRIGLGQTLKGSGTDLDEAAVAECETFGKHIWLAIPDRRSGWEYPLNLPPKLFELADPEQEQERIDEVTARLAWPAPFYKNRTNPWPCVVLGFHPKPRSPWCHSHVTPAMGLQKAINWIFSFLMARVRVSCRAFLVVPKGINEELRDTLLYGSDLELAEIEAQHPGTQQKLVEFLGFPQVNGEIWQLLAALKSEYEDATGVTELNLAGRTRTQARSATEMQVKREMLSIRPDDMAKQVDSFMADGAKLELLGAASLEEPDDVAVAFGERKPSTMLDDPLIQQEALAAGVPPETLAQGQYTGLWLQLIGSADLSTLLAELDFSVEAGSARKPDVLEQMSNVDESAQVLLPQMFQVYAQTGDPTQLNAWVTAYAKSRNIPDAQPLLFADRRQQMAAMQAAMQPGQQQPGGPAAVSA